MGVDIPSGVTGKFTATTLAQQLYSNNPLAVGNNQILFSNTVSQFSGSDPSFLQVNMQNFNATGSGDYIVTGDKGTNSNNYIDMGLNGSNFQTNYTVGSAFLPNDGYLYVQGTGNNAVGNLLIGTTSPNTRINFVSGGANTVNIVAYIDANGIHSSTIDTVNSLATYANTLANTALSYAITLANRPPSAQVNAAFSTANAAYAQANTNANNITLAWNKANNALANATGTFAGDLTFTGNVIASGIQSTTGAITTGNLIVNGTTTSNGTANITGTLNVAGIVNMNAQVVLTNTSFTSSQAALTIAATPTVATPSQDGYMIHISGKQNVSSRIVTDSYGANTYVVYAGRSARGNVAYPSAVQNGDVLARFSGNGFGTTGFAPLGVGKIDIVAVENFTDSARGSQIQFFNMITGTNTLNQIATFNATDVVFTGEVNPQKGFVLTPNVISGITTSLTIDIANTSLFRFTTNATTTISLTGFKAGKIVEVWITNNDTGAGSNHTITHGCLANNSTVGAASFTLTSLHSAYIKYFSIDGDQANVFCQVSYS